MNAQFNLIETRSRKAFEHLLYAGRATVITLTIFLLSYLAPSYRNNKAGKASAKNADRTTIKIDERQQGKNFFISI